MQVWPGGKIVFQKWIVFVFTESWSRDKSYKGPIIIIASRFGSFTVGFLLKRVYRHLPYKPLKLLFGKKSVRDTIKSQKQWSVMTFNFINFNVNCYFPPLIFSFGILSRKLPPIFVSSTWRKNWVTLHSCVCQLHYSLSLLALPKQNIVLYWTHGCAP